MQFEPEAPRGITPVVGVVVLVGMVFASAAVVVLIGGGMVGSLQDEASTEQATASMDVLASNLEGSGETAVHAPHGGQAHVDSEAGSMRIDVGDDTIVDENLGALYYDLDGTRLAYQGGGVWRMDDGQRGTMQRAPPIQYAGTSDPTLILPVVSISEGDGPADGKQLRTVETQHVFPTNDGQTFNPVANETVEIVIQSEFYEAWGEHFEAVLGVDVTYDHDAQVVGAELQGADIYEPEVPQQGDGMSGFTFNEGTELDIRNNVSIDSYDSTTGPYAETGGRDAGHVKSTADDLNLHGDNGGLTIHGDVDVTGHADVTGQQDPVVVHGDTTIGASGDRTTVTGTHVTFHGSFSTKEDLEVIDYATFGDDVIVGGTLHWVQATIEGDLHVHGDTDTHPGDVTVEGDLVLDGPDEFNEDGIEVHGEVVEHADDSELLDPRDPDVELEEPDVDLEQTLADLEDENDNAGPDDIDAGTDPTLQNCGGTCELNTGEYYLSNVSLSSGDRLLLNVTEGPIELGVDGHFEVADGAVVEIEYDPEDQHAVSTYVDGDFDVDDGRIEIEGDRAPLFEVFVAHDATWTIDRDAEFRGAVYGQEENGERTDISLKGNQGAAFYGAVLGDIQEFDTEAAFHRDEALGYGRIGEYDPAALEDSEPRLIVDDADVAYLHVEHRSVGSG